MSDVILRACEEGNIDMLRYIKKYVPKYKFSENDFYMANLRGKIWLMKIVKPSHDCFKNILYDCCKNKYDILEWLLQIKQDIPLTLGDYSIGFKIACENNHYDGAKILYDNFYKCKQFEYISTDTLETCCKLGYYIIIKWLLHIDDINKRIIINNNMILSVCLNLDLYFAKEIYSEEMYPNLDKKYIYAKYISFIGYTPSLDKIQDKYDHKRIEIMEWLKN
jgi:hypothetical protein